LNIAPGYHAQSHKPLDENLIPLEVKLKPADQITAYAPIYPAEEIHDYPALGKVSVYTGRVIVYVPFEVKPDAPEGPITLAGEIAYQICDDKACLAPEDKPFEIKTEVVPASRSTAASERPELFKGFDFSRFATLAKPLQTREGFVIFGHELASNSYFLAFVAAFIVGIIFNVMPCVLPVVPLKAIGFYNAAHQSRLRSLLLGAVFSSGVVVVFALLGLIVVVLRKADWGVLFTNPIFLGVIVVLLLLVAVMQFGVLSFILPTAAYRLDASHETVVGNFLWGIFTAILSTPCTFGMFLGLLIWATTQPALVGMLLLVTVGFGMAFPYLVLSAFPELARRMPRTGPWAELVKQMMGFLLLLSAVFFARRFIQGWVGPDAYWWSLFSVVAVAAAFLVTRTYAFAKTATGMAVALVLALLMVAPAGLFVYRVTNPPIDWVAYEPEKLKAYRDENRIVLVEFTADWCGNCLALETTVFHDEKTVQAIRSGQVVPVRVDLTKKEAPGWTLLREISDVAAIPLTAIYSPNLPQPIKLAGVYGTDDLVGALEKARGAGQAVARVP
jgi:thiol:disulfide interchange protein